MQRLKERQAERTSGLVSSGDPARPADVDEDTWHELKIYLGREQSAVAWDIRDTLKSNTEAKRLLVILRADRSPSPNDLQRISDTVAEVARNEQRVNDLRAGLEVPNFHGAELDLEHPRLHQIGCIGTGGRGEVRLIYTSDGRRDGDQSLVRLEWQRFGERTRQLNRTIDRHYRLYVNGRPTNITSETHEVDPNAIDETSVVRAATVPVTLHDPDFFTGVNAAAHWEYGATVTNNHAYQITKVENGCVELVLIDLAKLKREWTAAKQTSLVPPPTEPAGSPATQPLR